MNVSIKQKRIFSHFIILILFSIIVTYFLPTFVTNTWYFLLLVFFLVSKNEKNHIWLLFFWFILVHPGHMFLGIPSIGVPGFGREIKYEELFAVFAIIKVAIKPVQQDRVFYYKPMLIFISYGLVLVLMGIFYGSSIITVLKSIRYFIPLLLLLMIPKLISYDKVIDVIKLMFVCVFILVFAQMFDIVVGSPIGFYLGESTARITGDATGLGQNVFNLEDNAVRTVYGALLLLTTFIISLALLHRNNILFKKNYLYIISFISAFSIFMSATRGWIVSVVLIFFGYAAMNSRKALKPMLAGSVFLVFLLFIPNINKQVSLAFERVLTLETLAKGDISAGGTLKRLTERGPRVMSKFYESPIIGFGFSEEFYKYNDRHVGNQNLLLNGGIIGYLIFLYLIIYMLLRFYKHSKWNNTKIMMVFFVGIIGLLAIHSSSRMVFAYSMRVDDALALGVFFFVSDYFLRLKSLGRTTNEAVPI